MIADSDALTGDSLATFKASARITPDMCPDEQRRRLREVGVAVLSDGEIEDYYPIEALADLAGENPDTMQQRIDAAKTSYEMPEGIGFVEAIISRHQREIADAKPERVGSSFSAGTLRRCNNFVTRGRWPRRFGSWGNLSKKGSA